MVECFCRLLIHLISRTSGSGSGTSHPLSFSYVCHKLTIMVSIRTTTFLGSWVGLFIFVGSIQLAFQVGISALEVLRERFYY